MKLSEKVVLKPREEDLKILWQLSGTSKDLYNLALEQRRDIWRQYRKPISMYEQKRQLTELRNSEPKFQLLYSLQAQEVIRQLDQNYRSFFEHFKSDKSARPPGFRSFRYFFTLRYLQSGFEVNFKKRILTLHYDNRRRLGIPFTSHRPGIWERIEKVKGITISQDKVNKLFYASINYEMEEPAFVDNGIVAGNDPGIKTFLTQARNDGTMRVYESVALKRINRYFNKQIDKVKSKRDGCKKGSRRWQYLTKIIHKLYHRRNAQIKQQLHLIAKDANSASYNAIGKFNKKEVLSRNPGKGRGNQRINRAVQNDWPIARYINVSGYKATLEGHKAFPFDETGTTRTCSRCGYVFPVHLDPSIRIFRCPKCSFAFDRDGNSGINVLNQTLADLARPLMKPDKFRQCTAIHFTLQGKRIAETHPLTAGCSLL